MPKSSISSSSPSFRYSRIAFQTDLTSAHSRSIPLGVVAELDFSRFEILVLVARTSFALDESLLIGDTYADLRKNPAEYLISTVDSVLDSWCGEGSILDAITDRCIAAVGLSRPWSSQSGTGFKLVAEEDMFDDLASEAIQACELEFTKFMRAMTPRLPLARRPVGRIPTFDRRQAAYVAPRLAA
jgi:hypothetical protein